jgi:hypothetical protein
MEQVRAHVGAFLNTHPNPAFIKGATFIEGSFEIFVLPTPAISAAAISPRGIVEFLRRTGRWHHQLSQKGAAVGIAHSGPAHTFHRGWNVHAVFASPLAAKVATAIDRIDRERPDDDLEALYVTIPAYKIVSFLLRGYSSEEIFVVSNKSAAPGAEEGRFYPPRDFLNTLLQHKQIRGLVLK